MTYGQIQRLYSNAFDDGFEFFVQKEFGLIDWIKEKAGIVTKSDLQNVKDKAEKEKESLEEKARSIIRKKQENYNSLYGEYNDEKLAHNKTKEEAARTLEDLQNRFDVQGRFLEQSQKNSKHYENLSNEQKIALEKALEEKKALEEAAKRAGEKEKGFEKSLRKWKIGAGVTAGVAGLGGLGAYLYNRKKNKD